MKTLVKMEDHIELLFPGVDISLVNALRRIAISEINTIHINEIEIIENTTSLKDEFLAHRLSLIPLRVKNIPCKCEDKCVGCNIELVLDMICNQTKLDVMSNHFNKNIFMKDILICQIKKGQSIKLRAKIVEGDTNTNYKSSPVSFAGFRKTEEGTKFFLQTTGTYSAKEILERSLDKLKKQINIIENSIK